MAYGVTSAGFEIKPLDQIIADMQAKQLASISASLDVSPTGLIGILNGIVAQTSFDHWQLDAALYDGMDPDQAGDDQLEGACLLTGTTRDAAQSTQVTCTVVVGAGFNQAPGTMFAHIVGNTPALFTNKETIASVGGGTLTGQLFQAVTPGPTQCLAGTLTVIAQALAGWTSITNPADGTVGRGIEGDPSLRQKREAELSAPGSATGDAIRSDVLEQMQPPTTSSATLNCTVLWNDTDTIDANSVPAHAIEVIAYQPGATSNDDQLLANLILASKDAGTGTNGTSYKDAIDSQSITERIYFTRPAAVNVWIKLTVFTNPKTFPSDGATLIAALLQSYSQAAWIPGATVYAEATRGQMVPQPLVLGTGIPGVINVTVFKIDTVDPAVASVDIPMTARQIATLARVDVTVT